MHSCMLKICPSLEEVWKEPLPFEVMGQSHNKKLFWVPLFCCYHYTCKSCKATIASAANDHEAIMTFVIICRMPSFAVFAMVIVGPLWMYDSSSTIVHSIILYYKLQNICWPNLWQKGCIMCTFAKQTEQTICTSMDNGIDSHPLLSFLPHTRDLERHLSLLQSWSLGVDNTKKQQQGIRHKTTHVCFLSACINGGDH